MEICKLPFQIWQNYGEKVWSFKLCGVLMYNGVMSA